MEEEKEIKKEKKDYGNLIAILTSTVALFVALITGLFSSVSTTRITDAERFRVYYQFLEHKMDKLEKVQERFIQIDQTSQRNDSMSVSSAKMATAMLISQAQDVLKRTDSDIATYSYLLTEEREEMCSEIRTKNEEFSLRLGTIIANELGMTVNGVENYNYNEDTIRVLINDIIKNGDSFKDLLTDELKATQSLFEELTTK